MQCASRDKANHFRHPLRSHLSFALLAFSTALPLLIGWHISPVTGKRNDVIYYVALARAFACASSRAWVVLFEFNLGALAALDTGINELAGECEHHRE